jgi:RNA polymerase sigma factor (sigma-70 family)
VSRVSEEDVIAVYRATVRALYAYVSRRVGGDVGLAEDLVQETWIRALNDWSRKGLPDNPLAWLIRVARNLLVSHLRVRRPVTIDLATVDVEDERFTPATPDTAATVGWGLTRLARSHAELLEAFYFEGKTVQEIADERSLSARAVEGRLRRARSMLKKHLATVPQSHAV